MHSSTKGNRLSPEASSILFMRSRYPAHPLSGHCDQCFVFQVSAPQALFEPAPVAFIDFHRRGQQIPSRPQNRAPHFVQPGPSRFVPVEPQHSLKSQSVGSGFLGGDPADIARNHNGKGLRVS